MYIKNMLKVTILLSLATICLARELTIDEIIDHSRRKIEASTRPCVGDNRCCSSYNPCALGEGDCDPKYSQCLPGLVCGVNQCRSFDYLLKERFPNENDLHFSGTDDCCILPNNRLDEWMDWLEDKARDAETEEHWNKVWRNNI